MRVYGECDVKEGQVQKEEKRFKVAVILCIYKDTLHTYLATPTAEGKGDGTLSPFDLAVEYEEADDGAGPWGTGTGKPTFKSPWRGVKLYVDADVGSRFRFTNCPEGCAIGNISVDCEGPP
jgi:hypothetical protein